MAVRVQPFCPEPLPPSPVAFGAALACRFLAPVPRRLAHSLGVARAASELTAVVGFDDAPVLVTAALVHDIGYGPAVARTGFHPLDGARFLTRAGLGDRVAALVAHHSGARFEAVHRGCAAALAHFARETSLVADALTYCDLTTGPGGQRVSVEARLADIRGRYAADSPVMRALGDSEPALWAACDRVERVLAASRTTYRSRPRAPSR